MSRAKTTKVTEKLPTKTDLVKESYRRRLLSQGFNPKVLTSEDYPQVFASLGWSEGTFKTALAYLSEADRRTRRGLTSSQREYIPTDKECKVVIREFGAFGTLLVGFGFRFSELWDMSIGSDYIRVKTLKGGNPLIIPTNALREDLRQAALQWALDRTNKWANPRALTYKWECLQRDGILSTDCTRHSFRHRFITNAIKKGLNIKEVANLVGHRSITTTERYYHSCPSERARAYGVD